MGRLQLLVVAIGVISNAVLAEVGQSIFGTGLTKFIEIEMKNWFVPGMSIAIVDGKNVTARGFGHAILPHVKATPDTLYYAGSTTKAQTAACLSSLIQKGSLKGSGWDTKISAILGDDFAVQDEWATKHLTIEDAVSHRSGMSRHDRALQRDSRNGRPLSTRQIVRNMRNLPYVREPRARFIYGNYMYITLSLVIEKLTKKPLGRVMRETIWKPLGMRSTYFGLREAQAWAPRYQLATGYVWNNETKKRSQAAHMPLTDLSGAAAVISSVNDYAKWIQGLLGEEKLFSEDVHSDIRKGRTIHIANNYGAFDVSLYSLGWFRRTFKGRIYYWHDGSMIGHKSLIYWFPNDKFGFVIFANGDDAASANNNIAWKIISDRFQIPPGEVGVDGHWRPQEQTEEQRFQDAIKKYYPNHPKIPLGFDIADLQGVYWNKGYGRMRLILEDDNKLVPGQNLLVRRPETTWHYALRLRHVYGNQFIAGESWLEDINSSGQFHPVTLVGGQNEVPRLVIEWWAGGLSEGNVTFTKVA